MKKVYQILGLLMATTYCVLGQAVESYIAVERHSKRVLVASNTEHVVPMGRFCQLATVKVALDWSKASGTSLGTPIAVPVGMVASNNSLKLQAGDRVTLRDLIYSVSMANDEVGALVIADFVGRHLLSHRGVTGDPIATFVKEMQSLAANLKMTDTTIVNPYGTSAAGGLVGTTTVSDIAKLTVGLTTTHGFEFYSKQKKRDLTVARATGTSEKLTVVNNNKQIGKLKITGAKATGPNSAIVANKDPYKKKLPSGEFQFTPVQLVVITLNSTDRDLRVKQLVTTGWQQYEAWRAAGYAISAERKEFLQ